MTEIEKMLAAAEDTIDTSNTTPAPIPDLDKISEEYKNLASQLKHRIIICGGTGCIANGAMTFRDALIDEMKKAGIEAAVELDVHNCGGSYVSKSGCQGFCQQGPIVRIEPEEILYCHVKAADAAEIVSETLIKGNIIDRLVYCNPATGEKCSHENDIPFYAKQTRVVLANAVIEPDDIREYIARGGYQAEKKALETMSAEQICQLMIDSGLRGRGGGGFPTGLKWKFCLGYKDDHKYVLCNGDEGDPGAFMNRSVMEGNPHSVLEGMVIAGKAIGASEGVIYVRAEYPLAIERLAKAIITARQQGMLGHNLFGTDFSFDIRIMEGAGAFVCGEETALLASVAGMRGMPMPKPPFPAEKGLYGKPSIINNVETLASVPYIITVGAEEFRKYGTEKSPGTKTFALTGHVANTGLIEVPFGSTLRDIVYGIGGGVLDNAGNITKDDFKAVQIGGPSGGCLVPEEHLDIPLDYDSLSAAGAIVGSGGLVVMNNQTCMVRIAHFFMHFTQQESCGKCVPCREGTKQMLKLLDDIIEGRGTAKTLELLEATAKAVQVGSLCALGKTAPNPVLSTLRFFRKEYEEHIFNKHCPTGECKALSKPEIDPEKCKGCSACARKCPVDAISGEIKKPYVIDQSKCIKCGACAQACRFGAVKGI